MRRIWLSLLALAAACASANIEGPKAYRAWCNAEQKFLGPWMESEADAEKLRQDHRRRWPWHVVNLNRAAQAHVKDRMQEADEGGGAE